MFDVFKLLPKVVKNHQNIDSFSYMIEILFVD